MKNKVPGFLDVWIHENRKKYVHTIAVLDKLFLAVILPVKNGSVAWHGGVYL